MSAKAPSASHTGARPTHEPDGIFSADGGRELMLDVKQQGGELRAGFQVALLV